MNELLTPSEAVRFLDPTGAFRLTRNRLTRIATAGDLSATTYCGRIAYAVDDLIAYQKQCHPLKSRRKKRPRPEPGLSLGGF